jgi:UDP-N-acetylenolpyruvoylglucosamine reductase
MNTQNTSPSPTCPYDVALLGVGLGANYGSVLTYYSLYKTLESQGHKVLMVSKIGAKPTDPEIRDTHAVRFAQEHYSLSKLYSLTSVKELNSEAHTFLVGSDQVWNYGISQHFGKAFYLDFAENHKRKISYAASFGHATDFAPPHQRNTISALMQRFNAISVREDDGVRIAREIYQVPATQVAEPIFLTSEQDYLELASRSTFANEGPYLLAYILDPTAEKRSAIQRIAGKLGLAVRAILDGWPHLFEANKAKLDLGNAVAHDVDTYAFLALYAGSSFVITDSFHGTAFAVKFNKPFISIGNERRGVTRFDSLFRLIGHSDRFVQSSDIIINEPERFLVPMDFSTINIALAKHVGASQEWLDNALKIAATRKVGLIRSPSESAVAAQQKDNNILTESRPHLTTTLKSAADTPFDLSVGEHHSAQKPVFVTNSDVWRISSLPDHTSISVNQPDTPRQGKHAWITLDYPLKSGHTYTLTIVWQLKTNAKSVNLHIRNPDTGSFRVIGKVMVEKHSGNERKDVLTFTSPFAGFSQIMLGAVHFTGEGARADIRSISLVPASHRSLPRAKSQPTEPTTPGKNRFANITSRVDPKSQPPTAKRLAIPADIPTREQLVLSIHSDPVVQSWQKRIRSSIPSLVFFVGRELKQYTWNKVGGPADILALPKTIDELSALLALCNDEEIRYTVLGKGSNILVRDGGIRGLVILTTELNHLSLDGNLFTCGAGAGLIEASFYLLDQCKSGLEWAAGIPGTIGGAVWMNAGTYKGDIRSCLHSATIMNREGELIALKQMDIEWGVRYTSIQKHRDWIIVQATFAVTDGDRQELAAKMLGTVQSRENNMPLESPNHGSTFKWYRAPRLIQQAGLVGTRIGGVKISQKQPGFFINVKQATASDYEALINYTIAQVYSYSGFLLEPEVEIIGDYPYRYKRYSAESRISKLE